MIQIRSIVSILVVVAAMTATACKNPRHCDGNPDEDCLQMWDGQSGGCSSNDQCTTPKAVCDTGTSTCVQCIAPDQVAACSGTAPVCGTDETCRACASHDECSSSACLPSGACGDDTNVAYLDPGGSDNAQCTKAMPCTKVSKGLGTGRPFVKFTGTIDEAVSVMGGQVVTFLADPGAKLTKTGGGALITVKDNGTSLSVFDLSISDASDIGSIGVVIPPASGTPTVALTRVTIANDPGGGISTSGGSLTISQSTISGNTAGGISVTGVGAKFDITNTFIYRNGDPSTSMFGGLDLGIAVATGNRLEFNTIVDNQAAINSGGVICNVSAFAGANNIIARNFLAGVPATQTMGACTYPTSVVQNDLTGLAFVHSEPPGPFDYHLTSASTAAIDKALTTSSIDVDFDGDTRPQGPQKDIGADELR